MSKKSVDRRDMGEERQQTNLTVLLHDLKELDHDFGNGAHKNLALSTLFGVVHSLQRFGKKTSGQEDPNYITSLCSCDRLARFKR